MNITFEHIINELNISPATLQNWLKTNYLVSTKNGFITTESYTHFKNNILGKEKLNKRANKQYFNDVNVPHFSMNKGDNAQQKSLEYEQHLSTAYKNKKGIYYTPDDVIEAMFANLPKIAKNDTFLDPCCGTGNFLVKALEKGFKAENIYGFDIDKTALKIANMRFYQATGLKLNNIKNRNLLAENHCKKYDFIFTNPPWGYKFNPQQKTIYADKFNHGTKVDSSAFFVLICLNRLKKNGYLGVLLPAAFFNIAAFQSVRQKLLQKTLIKLTDHHQAFAGLQTKAYSFVVKNNHRVTDVKCQSTTKQYTRKQQDFINNPHCIINFEVVQAEADVITHLYSYPHQILVNKALWGMGIVTGNNGKHLKKTQENGYLPIYRGTDIEKGKIKPPKFYIADDFSKLQQTASKSLYLARKKIVYRFINTNLIFALDDKQCYFLNSANFFIFNQYNLSAEDKLQITEVQLVFLMNTKIMNWLFKKIFNTHKVLRSNLEKLPIFVDFFKQNNHYCEQDLYQYLNIENRQETFRIKA